MIIESGVYLVVIGISLIIIGQTVNIFSTNRNPFMSNRRRSLNCRHINELIDLWDGIEVPSDSRFLMSRNEKLSDDNNPSTSHFKNCVHPDCPSNKLFLCVMLAFHGEKSINNDLTLCSKRPCRILGDAKPFYRHIIDNCYSPVFYPIRMINYKTDFLANSVLLLENYGRFVPTCHHIANSNIFGVIKKNRTLNNILSDKDIFELLKHSVDFNPKEVPPCCSEKISPYCIWRSLVMITMLSDSNTSLTRSRNYRNMAYASINSSTPINKTKILDYYVPGVDHSSVVKTRESLRNEIETKLQEADDSTEMEDKIEDNCVIRLSSVEYMSVICTIKQAQYLGALFLTYHDIYEVQSLIVYS